MVRDGLVRSRIRARAWLAAVSAVGFAAMSALPAYASTNPVYDKEWALSRFDVTTIRSQYEARGSGVVVAVIDTGVDATQADLQGSLLAGVNLSVPANPTSDTSDDSSEYHGTDVTAIIAAHAHGDPNNPQGLYGLATQARILPVKIGDNGTSLASIEAGIRYAADHGARVMNISAGRDGACSSDAVAAVNYALSKGAVVVVATGNTGSTTNAVDCPASVPGVIDVSAIDQAGHVDKYSHYGSDVTVAAPGVSIEEPARGGGYDTASGSSLAAPWVAGEAALIIGKHPDWTAGQVVRVIIDNTVQATGQRIDDHVGYGVIDPLKALGASASSDTSNPLGGPATLVGASPGGGASGNGAVGGAGTASTPAAASSGESSSNVGLYAGLGIGVLVLIGLIVFLITRGKNNNGPGGGGGGGGGNGFHPPTPGPGGQYAQPPQSQQQYPASAPSQHY
jgi:subtilisin family serine protease